jgi:signal transduction histidine kinase
MLALSGEELVSQDQLGLFDTPPSRKQIQLSIAIVAILVAVLLFTLAADDVRLLQIDAFIPMIDATTFVVDLIIATLLYVQAAVYRSRALTALASSYVFTALILIPHALTFPGAFAPTGLLGAGTSTTAWLYIFWRAALPVAVILYVLFILADLSAQSGMKRQSAKVAVGMFAAIGLAAAATLLATSGHDLLPSIYLNRAEANYDNFISVGYVLLAVFLVAMAMLLWQRRSVLDLWLLVVLSAWLIQTVLLQSLQGRFTVSWYSAVVVVLLSHLFLMLALIAESSRLYSRLAMSTAARNRERDARLMSMDAVAATMAHEVGQPLNANIANATAALHWLSQTRPNVEKAISALRNSIDDGRRSFDVIKSIRAMFARSPNTTAEISLNDLVNETASLLDRELTGHKVALEMELDESVPPVLANRVQLQRVLLNLFSNAIESLDETDDRPRRIAIRSAALNGQDVLLEVSDSGNGIPSDHLAKIFDPFYTTKETGTGLGLSLCRTIVEEHGGRLWASPGKEHGATFHLQLPRSRLSA